jgi:hypothetical protein
VIAWDCGDTKTETADGAFPHILRHMMVTDLGGAVVAAARWLSASFPFPERQSISFTTGRLWLADGTATVRSVALPRR